MLIKKRTGEYEQFDERKIINAINAAGRDKETNIPEEFSESVAISIKSLKKTLTVEEIQDIVVKKLMASKYKEVAMAYQTWRTIRTEQRQKENTIYRKIGELIDASADNDDILNENANKDAKTISVQRDLLAGISSKEFYLNKVLPKHIAEAHEKGEIHVHDLDYLLFRETNCELVDAERMLKGGCKIGNAKMTEPNSVEVAVGHIVQIIASVSSNTFGGCTIPYIDRVLVPYVRKSFIKHYNIGLKYIAGSELEVEFTTNDMYFDGDWDRAYDILLERSEKAYMYAKALTLDSIKQAIQGLEYEINSLSTVNGQTPFTTIGFGTETTWEGREIQKAILNTRKNGFGAKKEVAIFPKLVFATCDEINFTEKSPNWDIFQLAAECMTKSIYPDILFVTHEQVKNGTVVYPMGCRAFLSPWKDDDGKEVYSGRFNLGATTINLPRIAIKNRGNEAGFYEELDRVMDICRQNSILRAGIMENTKAEQAPILWQDGAMAEKSPKESIKDLVWGGYATISIGYIGLSEVSQLLYGVDFALDEEVYKKTYGILEYIKKRIDQFKAEDNLGYALYSTPSESLCDRFAKIDEKEFGIIEGITDKGYYDNSFHVSSRINITPFEKLEIEAKAHSIATGGHISYIETDSLKKNLGAVIDILKFAKEVGIHYMGINQPVDKCHVCGFSGEFLATEKGFECPQCSNHDSSLMNVIRRVCGYLSQPNARPFNRGKQKEVINRVKHIK